MTTTVRLPAHRVIDAERARRLRAHRRNTPLSEDDQRHGTPEGYTNWMCRCPRCTEAARIARRPVVRRRYKPLLFFPSAPPEGEDAQPTAC